MERGDPLYAVDGSPDYAESGFLIFVMFLSWSV